MDIYKRKNSKFWLADFTVDGQRFRKSTGVTTKTKAMEVAAGLLRQAQTGTAPARKGPMPVLSVFVEEQFCRTSKRHNSIPTPSGITKPAGVFCRQPG